MALLNIDNNLVDKIFIKSITWFAGFKYSRSLRTRGSQAYFRDTYDVYRLATEEETIGFQKFITYFDELYIGKYKILKTMERVFAIIRKDAIQAETITFDKDGQYLYLYSDHNTNMIDLENPQEEIESEDIQEETESEDAIDQLNLIDVPKPELDVTHFERYCHYFQHKTSCLITNDKNDENDENERCPNCQEEVKENLIFPCLTCKKAFHWYCWHPYWI